MNIKWTLKANICLHGCCYPLQCCHLLSLNSGSSVPASAGTTPGTSFLLSVSAIVESHEHPGNDTLVICNRKRRFHLLLWLSRESFGHRWLYPPVPGTNSCCCFCLSVNNWSTVFTNCTAICCSFKPYCRTICHVPIRGITCQWSPNWYFISRCWRFCKLS